MGRYSYHGWRPYVSVAQRRRRAAKKIARMKKDGGTVRPVEIAGRKIATTFWGDAWCRNLEAYSDYSNRLPRGRTYVRNGSVIDLRIEAARVRSLVSGSDMYEVDIQIERLAKKRWTDIKGRCAGKIDSLVELLQGSISRGVMDIVIRKGDGMFPAPREISVSCSCPDWATMCKHVAATLYGIGARLDQTPELLFTLRGVDPSEMVEAAIDHTPLGGTSRRRRVLESDELSSVFGVEIDVDGACDEDEAVPIRSGRRAARRKKTGKRSIAARKPRAKKSSRKANAATRKAATKKTRSAVKKAAARQTSAGAASRAKRRTIARRAAPNRIPKTGKPATRKVGKEAGVKKTSPDKQATRSRGSG